MPPSPIASVNFGESGIPTVTGTNYEGSDSAYRATSSGYVDENTGKYYPDSTGGEGEEGGYYGDDGEWHDTTGAEFGDSGVYFGGSSGGDDEEGGDMYLNESTGEMCVFTAYSLRCFYVHSLTEPYLTL